MGSTRDMREATSADGEGRRDEVTRRRFLRGAALAGGLAALGGAAHAAEPEEGEVAPAEDLMREHGVLRRLLLVYETGILRMRGGGEAPAAALHEAAGIIRDFIEQYHEKLEEDHIFPLFKDSAELGPLTQVLTAQHQAAGR